MEPASQCYLTHLFAGAHARPPHNDKQRTNAFGIELKLVLDERESVRLSCGTVAKPGERGRLSFSPGNRYTIASFLDRSRAHTVGGLDLEKRQFFLV